MKDKELRALQDEFLKRLDASGFHKRNKDSMSIPLFDRNSPTVIQVQRDLWPSYAVQFSEFVESEKHRETIKFKAPDRPGYFKNHGKKLTED